MCTRRDYSRLRLRFAGDGLCFGRCYGYALSLLGVLDLRLTLECRRLLSNPLLLFQLGDAHRLLTRRFADADVAQLGRVRYLHHPLTLGVGDAHFAQLFLIGNVTACLLYRRRSRLAPDRLDVPRFVVDVGDVHVDEHQSDLLELRLQRLLNVVQKCLAILVDLLDAHGGDDLPKLPEDDVLRLALHLRSIELEQANGGVGTRFVAGADGNGEHARYANPDVLEREGIAQGNVYLNRLEAQIVVFLDDRPHERAAARKAACHFSGADFSRYDQNLVARASLVARYEQHQHAEQRDGDQGYRDGRPWHRVG